MRLAFLGLAIGASVILYGLWLAWPPLAFVVGGALVAWGSLIADIGGDDE